jgi:REP element-mobilizing transposase RayT
MAQSLARVTLHLVFSTKNHRRSLVTDEMRQDACRYMTGTFRELDCPVLQINAAADHVHVLHSLSRTRTIADVVGSVKRSSSAWIRAQPWARRDPEFTRFHWQNGYGVFSVSESNVPAVLGYIARQEEHHRRMTFQEEVRALLKRHNVAYDERYVWD